MVRRTEIFDRVKKATVAIVGMNVSGAKQPFTIFGSGFCIEPVGVVVTCRHVMDSFLERPVMELIEEVSEEERDKDLQKLPELEALRAFAVFYDMETRAAQNQLLAIPCAIQNLVSKTDFDLSVFRVGEHKLFEGGGFPYLEFEDYEEISEGQQIGVCGFPLGSHLQDQIGTVTSSFTS